MDADELAALNRALERRKEPELARIRYSMQVCDHDAENRAELEAAGIIMDPAIKDRASGIQIVYEHLEPRTNPETGALEPQLLFMRNACRQRDPVLEGLKRPTCSWAEYPGLRWEKKKGADEGLTKEDIVKDRDDGFDTDRYLLKTLRDRGPMRLVKLIQAPREHDD
jgi:hypothetical protein